MLSDEKLHSLLKEFGISLAGVIAPCLEADITYAFISTTRDKENKQQPSNHTLSEAKKALLSQGIYIEFLLVDATSQDIETGLRATLRHTFDKEIRNVFLSWEGKKGKIWVEPKYVYSKDTEKAIADKSSIYLSQFNIEIDSIVRTSGENFPTMLACLNRIRHLAPVSEQTLHTDLTARGFTIPSADWLRRRLDSMRRNGKLVRLSNGTYALTLSSLRILGTVKSKRSPDITRMLALARRAE